MYQHVSSVTTCCYNLKDTFSF